MTWRVLISAPYLLAVLDQFRDPLESKGIQIITANVEERLSEANLLHLVADIDGAICGDDPFTARVLRAAPRLKVISKWGTGIDSIDASTANELGITIRFSPNAFTDPVADTVLGYVLCFARRLPLMDTQVRQGKWCKQESTALKGKTLGVVGVGNIGRAVVTRAVAFGMNVMGNDVATVPEDFIAETHLKMVSLNELLTASDFVTLNCDLNPSSYHLIGAKEFAMMRPSAYLINTARGSVVDERALIDALRQREIAGAALDVFEVEPLPLESPLRQFGNCLFAPHNANSDLAARERVHESTINNLLTALSKYEA